MDVHSRRRKMYSGLAEVADVITDILREAEDAGKGGLNSVEITGICGLDPNDQERVEWPERDVVLGVLRLMERDGEVYNENEAGPGSWWLGSG